MPLFLHVSMGLTETIKSKFSNGSEITVKELYEKFVSPELSGKELEKNKHRVRGVLSDLKKRVYIIRLTKGVYTKN